MLQPAESAPSQAQGRSRISGCGSDRLVEDLPAPTSAEVDLLRRIASASRLGHAYRGDRPFRAPHHTASERGMRGDGWHLGELSLAHDGVILLDEASEWSRAVARTTSEILRRGHVDGAPAKPARVILACDPEGLERTREIWAGLDLVEIEMPAPRRGAHVS